MNAVFPNDFDGPVWGADMQAAGIGPRAAAYRLGDACVARVTRSFVFDRTTDSDLVLIPVENCKLKLQHGAFPEQTLRLAPFTMLLLRAGHHHDIETLTRAEMLVVAVDAERVDALIAQCVMDDPTRSAGSAIAMSHPDAPPLVRTLAQSLSRNMLLSPRVAALTVELLLSYCFMGAEHGESALHNCEGLSPALVEAITDQIDTDISERILINELAEMATMSPSQFSRAFKSALGLPPQKYVLRRRLQVAQDLLKDETRPLVEVALDAGFSSQAHMTSSFTKHFGLAPGQFRKLFGYRSTVSSRPAPDLTDAALSVVQSKGMVQPWANTTLH
ncbi:AraC family transcriptional regulator [Sulfitobacter sp. S190]|uniref:helix-turn-helix transcriptional regulator n=1 Tax=Sulfitobacter sp. S190 TaxID=2867022 RepID=UPI0021A369D1|nr:AraC family transcriptional regulator [Sulfitobacter sp. S190]UWR24526.1 AraC family transcriptional regulator [Sulfitobacter sp. S190]